MNVVKGVEVENDPVLNVLVGCVFVLVVIVSDNGIVKEVVEVLVS